MKTRVTEAAAGGRSAEHQRQETAKEEARKRAEADREEARKAREERARHAEASDKERRQAYRHHLGAVSKDPAFLGKSQEEISAEVQRRIQAEEEFVGRGRGGVGAPPAPGTASDQQRFQDVLRGLSGTPGEGGKPPMTPEQGKAPSPVTVDRVASLLDQINAVPQTWFQRNVSHRGTVNAARSLLERARAEGRPLTNAELAWFRAHLSNARAHGHLTPDQAQSLQP